LDFLAPLVEIVTDGRDNCDITMSLVELFEEGKGVAASDDAGALVVEEGCGGTFEDSDGVAETFEDYTCEETTKGTSDYNCVFGAGHTSIPDSAIRGPLRSFK
jgi:hypothetical protein